MLILLLLLAISATYCFAVFRWTRQLPVWLRRLTRSFLLSLFFPFLVVQADYSEFVPRTIFYTCYWGDVNLSAIKELAFQTLGLWGLVYGLWLAVAGICGPHADESVRMRHLKLAAVICSCPSWILGLCFVLYRFGIDGRHWPYLDQFAVPCLVCVICSLAAMTMFLISMSDFVVPRSDILLFLWSAFPICLATGLGCLLWFFVTFGNKTMEDIYGY
jgi:hypothetical protein